MAEFDGGGGVALCVVCDVSISEAAARDLGNKCLDCCALDAANECAGQKFDQGKPRHSLVPPDAMEQFVAVLTYGAMKYSDNNWSLVPDLQNRYYDALQRHLAAYRAGDSLDDESGLHHLAHAMSCVAFMMQDDIAGDS